MPGVRYKQGGGHLDRRGSVPGVVDVQHVRGNIALQLQQRHLGEVPPPAWTRCRQGRFRSPNCNDNKVIAGGFDSIGESKHVLRPRPRTNVRRHVHAFRGVLFPEACSYLSYTCCRRACAAHIWLL